MRAVFGDLGLLLLLVLSVPIGIIAVGAPVALVARLIIEIAQRF